MSHSVKHDLQKNYSSCPAGVWKRTDAEESPTVSYLLRVRLVRRNSGARQGRCCQNSSPSLTDHGRDTGLATVSPLGGIHRLTGLGCGMMAVSTT